jgi:radical SAM family uncharacterized protein
MLNQSLKDHVVARLLPRVNAPGQYIGGELNAVVKDHRAVRGKLCLAFPDTYAIGMSNHGLQVLYAVMNRRPDWACERTFTPWPDMEALLRQERIPLYSLETFTPVGAFDVLGFTLQYDLCSTNVLTMLDLAGIPLATAERTLQHPLVMAGGPCAQNPEPMARFIDLFVIGDGEEALPAICEAWLELRTRGGDRLACLIELARRFPMAYVPQSYETLYDDRGRPRRPRPIYPGVPELIQPAVVGDLDGLELPTRPIVPSVECVHDRIALEIMRGCPWRCRFCQSSPIKRPLRYRRVETIVDAAKESYRTTGNNEISLLSLSTSDYPHFEELMRRMQETFRPLGVSVSVPSLRVNEQLLIVTELMNTDRHSGLTFAPEVALDDMRRQIGKPIRNEDLFAGSRKAFEAGFNRVKLYFMCGLPGERPADLDGILEMADAIWKIGRDAGRSVKVVANVSNFVPKPHSPYQWNGMQSREYLRQAHQRLRPPRGWRGVEVKCHDIDTSLLEGVLGRGDRRVGAAIELAWRRGARLDSWTEHHRADVWRQALADAAIDVDLLVHQPYPVDAELPWDHIGVRQGRGYLEQEQRRSVEQLETMRGAEVSR